MMQLLRKSIVLSTYNGERYLPQLLDSLRKQSIAADEVLIVDDCSTDGTVKLIADYIESNSLDSWRLCRNERNRGWMKNFKEAILAASGDLIFPCDQDDIWDSNKLEFMSDVMRNNPNINVLACEVKPFYEEGSDGYKADTLQRNRGEGSEVCYVGMDTNSFLYTMRPGCSFCIRRAFAHDIDAKWRDTYPHDATLWRYAAVTGTLALLNMPLVNFRRHGANASSRGRVTKDIRLSELEYYIDFYHGMIEYLAERRVAAGEAKELLPKLIKWLSARKSLMLRDAVIPNMVIALRGRRWYSTWKSPLVDIYFVMFPKGVLHA